MQIPMATCCPAVLETTTCLWEMFKKIRLLIFGTVSNTKPYVETCWLGMIAKNVLRVINPNEIMLKVLDKR
jgi:hypothetical protein